jgi:hypothetical protein
MIEDGKYSGYGYIGIDLQFNQPHEIKEYIKKAKYYPDADDLLRGWMKQGKKFKKIVFNQDLDAV